LATLVGIGTLECLTVPTFVQYPFNKRYWTAKLYN
jgi:hypothetical protein